ncbi:hypothetical protein B0E45_01015 [Sinorhizobium sp. A49]|nr:hypothetical protein B0E45_01015 [Sinorhizobium sp. A49]
MNDNPLLLPTPARALLTDDPIELLKFAAAAFKDSQVAIATLVEIRGGAARSLGSQVIVLSDGRFAGYVSGGCVEAAVAAEALLAMAEGRDRTFPPSCFYTITSNKRCRFLRPRCEPHASTLALWGASGHINGASIVC